MHPANPPRRLGLRAIYLILKAKVHGKRLPRNWKVASVNSHVSPGEGFGIHPGWKVLATDWTVAVAGERTSGLASSTGPVDRRKPGEASACAASLTEDQGMRVRDLFLTSGLSLGKYRRPLACMEKCLRPGRIGLVCHPRKAGAASRALDLGVNVMRSKPSEV